MGTFVVVNSRQTLGLATYSLSLTFLFLIESNLISDGRLFHSLTDSLEDFQPAFTGCGVIGPTKNKLKDEIYSSMSLICFFYSSTMDLGSMVSIIL